jgi:hypothetical protein
MLLNLRYVTPFWGCVMDLLHLLHKIEYDFMAKFLHFPEILAVEAERLCQ